jgi:hypothetical protein
MCHTTQIEELAQGRWKLRHVFVVRILSGLNRPFALLTELFKVRALELCSLYNMSG